MLTLECSTVPKWNASYAKRLLENKTCCHLEKYLCAVLINMNEKQQNPDQQQLRAIL